MAIEVHKKLAGLSALDDGLVSRIAHSRTRAGSRGDLLLPATRKDNFKYSSRRLDLEFSTYCRSKQEMERAPLNLREVLTVM